tara:strand:+ start:3097 stop:4398 length:1302 start_codon:yes stop_codon:yes gene_type:complete
MAEFTCEIIKKEGPTKENLSLEIKGNEEYGLNRTIINGIRRTLLSSIETFAFRTTYENSDIVIEKNNTSLHNEFILDRIGLIPLYIDPTEKPNHYLFTLNVRADPKFPVTLITAEDFEIFELKNEVLNSSEYQHNMITNLDKSYYKDTPITDKKKKEIFRPYNYNGKDSYCLLHELKSNNSEENIQELVLYGSPSISIAKEDARWQGVSCATYSFKIDEEMFQKVLEEKLKIAQVDGVDREAFSKDLELKESQRYFHRDINTEAYWYNFDLSSQHFLSSKDLLIRSIDILIESLETFKEEIERLSDPESTKNLIEMVFYKEEQKHNIIKIICNMPPVIQLDNVFHGIDDSICAIIQAHMSNHIISDKSLINVCGYKRSHPLENSYIFTISLNPSHHLGEMDAEENIRKNAIVQVFSECCDELIGIFNRIKSSI